MLLTAFHFDAISFVMTVLIGFVGLCVAIFSWRYFQGDYARSRFYASLSMILLALFTLVSSDHIVLFLSAWASSNLLLIRLMVHKKTWKAANESGLLTLKHFAIGFAAIVGGVMILCSNTNESSIQALVNADYDAIPLNVALCFISIGAMIQCGLWPFHRWLISSLNSPTPTSAIMHAGLVNGGGLLLARFAPLYVQAPTALAVLFIAGIATALVGTLWKLLQSDIKRMLACSTMGQMGFMIAQCGLGLFPLAIAHLCWHGVFKAHLFLASGDTAKEKRFDLHSLPSSSIFMASVVCGLFGAFIFAMTSRIPFELENTTMFLIGMTWVAGTQFAISILTHVSWRGLPIVILASLSAGAFYGFSVYLFETLLVPMHLMQPQKLNSVHIIGFIALVVAWLLLLFGRNLVPKSYSAWILRLYVMALNASQPHPKTITAHRNHYQYK